MNGCDVILEEINFHEAEALPEYYHAGTPHICTYFPESLLVRVPGMELLLKDTDFPPLLAHFDRRGLVLLRPEKVVFAIETEGGIRKKIKVTRNQFKIGYSNARTTYGAQGEQSNAMVCDLQRPPRISIDLRWLACYVILSWLRLLTACSFHVSAPELS